MIGQVIRCGDDIHQTERTLLVHKDIPAGGEIPEHNHPNHNIYFIVTKGKFNITLGGSEVHEVKAGEALQFSGDNTISAQCDEDSQAFVSLTKMD
ncbi:MAG: cupin domain-containing protein [Tissierellia bacterium]|nr:cupin domain-containing protein [Tissierellia bacterium]